MWTGILSWSFDSGVGNKREIRKFDMDYVLLQVFEEGLQAV